MGSMINGKASRLPAEEALAYLLKSRLIRAVYEGKKSPLALDMEFSRLQSKVDTLTYKAQLDMSEIVYQRRVIDYLMEGK